MSWRIDFLPRISGGGGPPKAVEGFFRRRAQDPSTSYAGPPPLQLQGRRKR